MSTPTRGVPVELDRTRHLRYSMATLAELEEKFGDLKNVSGIRNVIHLLWAGLRHEDPDLTEAQVGEIVDGENLPSLLEAVTKAMGGDVQAPDPKPETPAD